MAFKNSIPSYGTLETSLSTMFVNDVASPVQIRLLKLTNNSSSQRILSIYLNSKGVRTPLLPENFKLNSGHMASDDLVLTLRKNDSVEGIADAENSVAFVIS